MSMIICKECGKEISDKASICPNCGCPIPETITKQNNVKKKDSTLSILAAVFGFFTLTAWLGGILAIIDLLKKDKTKRHIGSGFALFMCIAQLAMCSVKDTDDTNVDKGNIEEVVNVQISENSNKENQEMSNEEEKKTNEVTVGNSFEAKGLKVTLNDASIDFTDYDDEYGLYKLEDGYKYVMASFTFENKGDSDVYVSIYDFECYSDGTLCEQAFGFDEDFINVNLSAGRNVSFKTYYKVPVDCQSTELEYTANYWTGEKVIVKIQ